MFGDVEGALEGLVQPAAGVAVLEGEVVGLLELAEDFGLAQHHGIEAAGDLEQVLQALGFAQGVELFVQRVVIVVRGAEELLQARRGSAAVAA